MKRYAVHRLLLSPDCLKVRQVIEVEGGKLLAHYPLTDELPFTEWIGGTVVISGHDVVPLALPVACEEACRFLLDVSGVYAWHISAEEWASGRISVLRRL